MEGPFAGYGPAGYGPTGRGKEETVVFVLWLVAVALVVGVTIARSSVPGGIARIVLGLLVGPGGVSLFA